MLILTSFYSGWAKNPLAWVVAGVTNQQVNHKIFSVKVVIELSDDSTRFGAIPEDWCEVYPWI